MLHASQSIVLTPHCPMIQAVKVSVNSRCQEAEECHPQGSPEAEVHVPHGLIVRILSVQFLCKLSTSEQTEVEPSISGRGKTPVAKKGWSVSDLLDLEGQ